MSDDKYTILLVDDEEENLNYLKRVLRFEYNLLTASSGPAALEILRSHEIAIVVSDLRMPGMNGVELLQHVSTTSPSTVRVMLTAYADLEATIDAINSAQVNYFLRKPVTAPEIKSAMETAVKMYKLRQLRKNG